MTVEDEFFSVIENRDTAIMMRDKKIAEQDTKIAKQDTMIAKQNTRIAEQDSFLRSMVKVMLGNGMSVEDIAKQTGKSVAEINSLL